MEGLFKRSVALTLMLLLLTALPVLANGPGTVTPAEGYTPGTWPAQGVDYNMAVNQKALEQLRAANPREMALNQNLEAAAKAAANGTAAAQIVYLSSGTPGMSIEGGMNLVTLYEQQRAGVPAAYAYDAAVPSYQQQGLFNPDGVSYAEFQREYESTYTGVAPASSFPQFNGGALPGQ